MPSGKTKQLSTFTEKHRFPKENKHHIQQSAIAKIK